MQLKVEYASRRDEIWRWYWRQWRQRLWKVHVLIFMACAFCAYSALYEGKPLSLSSIAVAGLIGIIPVALLPFYPLLRFKPRVRTLTIDESGVETTIGKISAAVAWKDVRSVDREGDLILIQRRNGNAFVVPSRAFASPSARDEFATFAGRAHAAVTIRTT